MFGSIGMPELIIILVIALIIFGPRKLPELGRSLGKSLGEFKRASNELRSTLEEEIRVEEQKDHAPPKTASRVAGHDARPAEPAADSHRGTWPLGRSRTLARSGSGSPPSRADRHAARPRRPTRLGRRPRWQRRRRRQDVVPRPSRRAAPAARGVRVSLAVGIADRVRLHRPHLRLHHAAALRRRCRRGRSSSTPSRPKPSCCT